MKWLKTLGILTADEHFSVYWVFGVLFGVRVAVDGNLQWVDVVVYVALLAAIGAERFTAAKASQSRFDAEVDRIRTRLGVLEEARVRLDALAEEQKEIREEQGRLSLAMHYRK